MKKVLLTICTLAFALGLSLGEAQAARLGGGKSVGMQRQAVQPQRAPAQQATPAQPAAPAAAPAPATPKRNWLGPVAGLAAGLGLAALASHFGFGEGLANVLTIALLAMAAVFVVRWLLRRNSPPVPARDALQYAAAGESVAPSAPSAQTPLAIPGGASASAIPADFDSEAFVRVAKLNFVRLQAANDAGNVDDIREFVAPELYAEIKLQIDERGGTAQQTDVVTLAAELLEVVSEGKRYVASVRFSGMLREAPGTAAQPFAEIWNLCKPVSGDSGWVIAGIQQVNPLN